MRWPATSCMGMWVGMPYHSPTTISVFPARAAWTALRPSWSHSKLSVVLAGIGVSTVVFHNTSALPILLVLSMVAFTGGVSVARLLPPHAPERQERIRKYRRDVQDKRPIGWIPPQMRLAVAGRA